MERSATTISPSRYDREPLPPTSLWSIASDEATGITSSVGFIEYAEKNSLDSDDINSTDYAKNLSDYILKLTEPDQGEKLSTLAHQTLIIGMAPHMINQSAKVNQIEEQYSEGSRMPDDLFKYRLELKRELVQYNQLISGYMYDNSDDSLNDIKNSITDFAIDYFDRHDISIAERTIDSTLKGARTEAATRHLFDAIGVNYRPATTEEDLRGTDIVLSYRNKDYLIDVKASLEKITELAAKKNIHRSEYQCFIVDTHKKTGEKKIVLFPGFTDSDLGDKLRPNENTDKFPKLCLIIGAQLQAAINQIDTK